MITEFYEGAKLLWMLIVVPTYYVLKWIYNKYTSIYDKISENDSAVNKKIDNLINEIQDDIDIVKTEMEKFKIHNNNFHRQFEGLDEAHKIIFQKLDSISDKMNERLINVALKDKQ